MLKHRKVYTILISLLTIFLLWYLLKDNYKEIINGLLNANYIWVLISIIFYFIYLLFDCLSFSLITNLYNKGISIIYQLYIGIVNKFVSGITPLATGGQPVQVYELHRKGVSISNGTNIAIQSYLIFQIAAMILGFTAILLNSILHYFKYTPIIEQMTIIGFIINFGILILLIAVSFSKSFNKKVVNFFINFLSKISKKIRNNKDKYIKKCNDWCDNYYYNAKILLQHKKVMIECIILQIISLIIYYSLPFIIQKALNINSINLLQSISASSYVFITGCYVPIPGASGGMEYAFKSYFGNFITNYKLNVLLILWRTLTFYMPVILGAIIFNIKHTSLEKKEYEN